MFRGSCLQAGVMRRRLLNMQSGQGRWPQILSMLILATLLLCQVVGALCPSVPPALGAAEAIRSAHAMHGMEAMNLCRDSIPSSSTSFKSFETSSVPMTDLGQPLFQSRQAHWTNHPDDFLLAGNGHSLLLRLSTFRI